MHATDTRPDFLGVLFFGVGFTTVSLGIFGRNPTVLLLGLGASEVDHLSCCSSSCMHALSPDSYNFTRSFIHNLSLLLSSPFLLLGRVPGGVHS